MEMTVHSLGLSIKNETGPTSCSTRRGIWFPPTLLRTYVSDSPTWSYAKLTLRQAFTFLREFVLGNNKTGSVVKNLKGDVVVIGGENATLAEDVLPGGDEIYYGAGATQSTYVFPSATRAAWREFIKTETAVPKVLSQNAGHPAFLPVCGTLTITLVVMVLSLLQHL